MKHKKIFLLKIVEFLQAHIMKKIQYRRAEWIISSAMEVAKIAGVMIATNFYKEKMMLF